MEKNKHLAICLSVHPSSMPSTCAMKDFIGLIGIGKQRERNHQLLVKEKNDSFIFLKH